jgi:hypothetical protein
LGFGIRRKEGKEPIPTPIELKAKWELWFKRLEAMRLESWEAIML